MSRDEDQIEEIKKKLYSPTAKVGEDIRRPLSKKESNISSGWSDGLSLRSEEDQKEIEKAFEPSKKSKFSVLISLLVLSFIFFAGALGYAYFAINNNKSVISNNNIDLAIVSPIEVGGGEALPLEITITNKNIGPLVGVDLIVEFPKGSRDVNDITQDADKYIKTLGTIQPGEVVREKVEAIVFGEENDNANIKVKLLYNAEGSSAIFTKEEAIDIALSAPPIITTVESLEEVTSGQRLSFLVTLESNSSKTLKDIIVVAKYPFGFSLADSSEQPFFNNRVWYIGELKPREKYELTIDGLMQGQNNEERYFDFSVGIQDTEVREQIAVMLGHAGTDVSIARPFLNIDMAFDREKGDVFVRNSGTTSTGEIVVENTTSNAVQNVEVVMDIEGEILDIYNISANEGFFNSNTRQIVWNSQSNGDLATLQPGESETLIFDFRINSILSSQNFELNPELLFTVNASADRPEESGVSDKLETSTIAKIAVATTFGVEAKTSYSEGPIINSGPVPPTVGQTTTYTITWTLRNTASRIDDAMLSSKLPQYITWTDRVFPSDENISYNPTTREIVWNVGSLDTRVGYSKPPREVSFQVELTPSTTQLGREVILVEPAKFIGYDSFAQVNRESQLEVVTTDLPESEYYRNGAVIE